MTNRMCPCCGEHGEDVPELGGSLLACMNINCRVNEFDTHD